MRSRRMVSARRFGRALRASTRYDLRGHVEHVCYTCEIPRGEFGESRRGLESEGLSCESRLELKAEVGLAPPTCLADPTSSFTPGDHL